MAKRRHILCLLALCMVFAAYYSVADDRTEPIDIIIALDKSLSMEEEIDAVKKYVNTRIVDSLLQNGDYFLVIGFYGETIIPVSEYIQGEDNKTAIKEAISQINADGRFTDIGGALDRLKAEVEKRSAPQRPKTLLLITDGKHEPPPTSKYYSPQGYASHEYLEITTETQKEGWKIIVLGVGSIEAQELAEQLDADFVGATGEPSAESLADIIPDLAGIIEVIEPPVLTPVGRSGKSKLSMKLSTRLFKDPLEVRIGQISVKTDGLDLPNLLTSPAAFELPSEGETEIQIPVVFPRIPDSGIYTGLLTFSFTSKERFDAEHEVDFRINTFIQDFPWFLPVAIVVGLAILFLIVFMIIKTSGSQKLTFRLHVEESPLKKGKDTFVARKGKPLYLREGMGILGIDAQKTGKSIAALLLIEGSLSLKRLKEDRFPETDKDQNDVLGKTIVVRTESGKDFSATFERI